MPCRIVAVNPLNNLLPKMPSTILVTGEGDGSPPLGEGQKETRGSAAGTDDDSMQAGSHH